MTTRPRRPVGRIPVRTAEDDWQQQVTQLAELLGWQWMHVRKCRVRDDQYATPTSIPGWFDLYLWHERQHRAMHVELKGDGGQLSADQRTHLASLQAAHIEAYVWWPRDLPTVETILRRKP